MGSTAVGALILAAAAAATGCAGKSKRTEASDPEPTEVTSRPPVGCAEELEERPLVQQARFATLATAADLRVESVDGDTGLVAYTVAEDTPERRALFVVPVTTGEPPTLLATGLPRIPEESELVVRFEQSTLLVLTGVVNDVAEELLVWRPGDTRLASIAFDVDPTAVRASRDGRYLSVEADDRKRDMKQTVTLLLVELAELSTRLIGDVNQPRARFTRDSKSLVFSKVAGVPALATVRSFSLEDGVVRDVASVSPQARWELTPDDAWLVHALEPPKPTFECPLLLAQTSMADGTTVTNEQDCLVRATGKELDVSTNGRQLAFLGRPADPAQPSAALRVRNVDGGGAVERVANLVVGIVDYFDDVLTYRVTADDDCGDEFLMSAPSGEGEARELGLFTSYCPTAPEVPRSLHHEDGALLALGPDGMLRFQPRPGEEPILLACGASGAALARGDLALFSAPHAGGTGLFRYDHALGEVRVTEPTVTGPFALTPRKRGWLAVTVPHPEGSALVGDHP